MAMRAAPACSAEYEEAHASFFDGGKPNRFRGEFLEPPKVNVRKVSKTRIAVTGGQNTGGQEQDSFQFTKPDFVPEFGICKPSKASECGAWCQDDWNGNCDKEQCQGCDRCKGTVYRMHINVNRPLVSVVKQKNHGFLQHIEGFLHHIEKKRSEEVLVLEDDSPMIKDERTGITKTGAPSSGNCVNVPGLHRLTIALPPTDECGPRLLGVSSGLIAMAGLAGMGWQAMVAGIELDLIIPEDGLQVSPMVANDFKKLEIPNLSVYVTGPRMLTLRMKSVDVHALRAVLDRLLDVAPGVFLKTADIYGPRFQGKEREEWQALMRVPACSKRLERPWALSADEWAWHHQRSLGSFGTKSLARYLEESDHSDGVERARSQILPDVDMVVEYDPPPPEEGEEEESEGEAEESEGEE